MTGHDDFDRTLAGWFEADALSPAPIAGLDRVLEATGRRSPRPAWLAGLGSHWVGKATDARPSSGARSDPRLGLRWSTVLVLLLVIAALIGGAILVGARLVRPSPLAPLGHLAYALDGDIYVSDLDGRNPVRIADGAPAGGPAQYPCEDSFGAAGAMWSPDGRHLAYRSCATVFISDPTGHVIVSFPGNGRLVSWSPDATRVATWVGGGAQTIGIYGLDGVRQALLSLPTLPGYTLAGDFDPVWSPDGKSILMRLSPVSSDVGPPQVWELPVDGRPQRSVPLGDPRWHWQATYSSDGTRMAFVAERDQPEPFLFPVESLVVGAADGSRDRVLISGGIDGYLDSLVWSPTGDRIAYNEGPLPTHELRVVDVATGAMTSLATGTATDHLQVIRFSPDGDRILYSRWGDDNVMSLWSVRSDGSDAQRLVTGTLGGDWQPLRAGGPGPVETPSPAPTAASPTTPSLPAFVPDVVPVIGPLDPGTYTYADVDRQGFNVRFTVPAGWTWNGRYLSKGGVGLPNGAAIFFFGGPVQAYADPCHWAEPQPSPPTGFTYPADALVTALGAQSSRSAKSPIDDPADPLGVANHWVGLSVELTVPEDLNVADCDRGQYRSWGPESNARIQQGPGQRDLVWAVDIRGAGVDNGQGAIIVAPLGGLIIDAASFPGTPADVMSDIEAILGSIVVGHWG